VGEAATKLTSFCVLSGVRDLSTGFLKTREIAGEDLGERPVLGVIIPLDIISYIFPTVSPSLFIP